MQSVLASDDALTDSPIEPSWIVEGAPRARSRRWHSSGDSTVDFYIWATDRFIRFMTATFDLNVPLLYQRDLNADPTVMTSSGFALGDISAGFKGVMLSSLQGHLLLGAMLRLQLPTGTFDRSAPEAKGRPVVIDPALGLAAIAGRFGLQTTQGLTIAAAALPVTQMRWSMGYTAEVQLGRLGLVAQLDAGIGLSGNAGSGAALGGGLRVHLGDLGLLLGARGGLGDSGAQVFGRYYTSLGLEWAPR